MGSFRRRTFSYDKLPAEPIRLSVLKLDGTTFDVNVTSSATVRDLKLAIETAFSHVPKKGPSKISWSHVWGHFCLCYGGQKLVTDTECIGSYGMKDGDEVRFKNHVSGGNAVLNKGYSRKSKQKNLERLGPKNEDGEVNRVEEIDHGSWDDIEKGSLVRYEDDVLEVSPGENRTCLTTVHGCCFAFGLKELLGFGNDKSYYSLRDTWRDD
ncbi:Ubiquitin-like superfamily protein [Raphanus sativus]|uniref:Uncharacterized protein LOC108806953 n=1 Tax=Raphanus sativus TaxID=3726 RepID=A0A6J0JGB5_RAPSA|nr:uncharacterized protein LOC108806953 [Raphanus sativus]KAJ4887924.1 Ubiquitin-like superfamily protein [Raphanus sativus]